MSDQLPDVGGFGAVYEDFMQAMTAAAERGESFLGARIRAHLGHDPKELPTTSVEFATTDHGSSAGAWLRSTAKRASRTRTQLYSLGHSRRSIRADLVRSMRTQIVAMRLADEVELNEIDRAVREHFADPDTLVMSGLMFLVRGRKRLRG